jgi:plasmid stabilization system protein ParE
VEREACVPSAAGGGRQAAASGRAQARAPTVSPVEIAPEVDEDFDRIFDHLAQHDIEGAPERIGAIIQAFDVLEANPLIGRPTDSGMRELIVGRGSRGDVALYRYVAVADQARLASVSASRSG